MARCFKFSLLALHAPSPRDERLNVGIAVFADGNLDVRLLRSLKKLGALSLAYSDGVLRAAASNLTELDRRLSELGDSAVDRLRLLETVSPFSFSPIAEFTAPNQSAYEEQIATILRICVEPEPAFRVATRGKGTPLTSALRKSFREDRILAAKGEDLSAHRVVSNVELAAGLVADFVLKNGAIHVFETVDASGENSSAVSVAKNVGLAALTIEQAKITYGNAATIARLIYQTTVQTESLITPALHAAEHQGVELINWASGDDQRKLRATVASLAMPLPLRGRKSASIIASTQPRFFIN